MSYSLPFRRTRDLSVQLLGNEVLVYDELRHKAFCLNAVSGWTWRLSDGRRTAAQIADAVSSELKHGVSEEIVLYALGELQRDGLLDSGPVAQVASRREMVKKLGFGAALMMPVVTAVFAPRAAEAYDGCLLPDTPVTLRDGSEMMAGLVAANTWVRGVDPGTGQFHDARVISSHRFRTEELLTFFTETGHSVQASASHLFIAGPGDVLGTRAAAFRVGDSLMVAGEEGTSSSVITGMGRSQVAQEVVIFELDTVQHCFVSGGVVSHNYLMKVRFDRPADNDSVPDDPGAGQGGADAKPPQDTRIVEP